MAKCRVCREPATARYGLVYACSIDHAIEHAKEVKAKHERKAIREARQRLKTRSQWIIDVRTVFNTYIRERDRDLPCISCGDFTPMTRGGDYDCGHYRSVGANPELRFEELNCHKQCKQCNRYLSGNVVNYRIGLLMRIGAEKVEWLEGKHEPKKYTIDDLKALKAEYKQKLKDLKANPVYPVI